MIKRKVSSFIEVDNKAKAKVIAGEDHIIKDKDLASLHLLDKETKTIVLQMLNLVKNILPLEQFLDESYILVFTRKKCWILSKKKYRENCRECNLHKRK